MLLWERCQRHRCCCKLGLREISHRLAGSRRVSLEVLANLGGSEGIQQEPGIDQANLRTEAEDLVRQHEIRVIAIHQDYRADQIARICTSDEQIVLADSLMRLGFIVGEKYLVFTRPKCPPRNCTDLENAVFVLASRSSL
jgi:hypothetical protein